MSSGMLRTFTEAGRRNKAGNVHRDTKNSLHAGS
jgi:hypothetical protein